MKSKTRGGDAGSLSLGRPGDAGTSAREHYRREKARRARQARPDSELLAAAKREYQALLNAEALKGKGGRPKKKAATPAAAPDETGEEHDEES